MSMVTTMLMLAATAVQPVFTNFNDIAGNTQVMVGLKEWSEAVVTTNTVTTYVADTAVTNKGAVAEAKAYVNAYTNQAPDYANVSNKAVNAVQYVADHSGGNTAIVVGTKIGSAGPRTMSVGYNNYITGTNAIAVGASNKSYGLYSATFGYGNEAYELSSIGIGYGNSLSAAHAIGIGFYCSADKENAIAMGNSAYAGKSDSFVWSALSRGATAAADGSFNIWAKNSWEGVYINGQSLGSKFEEFIRFSEDVSHGYSAITIGSRDSGSVGVYSWSMGLGNVAAGKYSYAHGDQAKAYGQYSHAEGAQTSVTGNYTYAWSGNQNGYRPSGTGTFNINPVGGLSGFYIGYTDIGTHMTNVINSVTDATNPVFSNAVLAVGLNIDTNAVQYANASRTSITIGDRSTGSAIGEYSMTIGYDLEASEVMTFAQGMGSKATGIMSHAEGDTTTASASGSHAEGKYTVASGDNSHAEGEYTIATGECDYASGWKAKAFGKYSRAVGIFAITKTNDFAAYTWNGVYKDSSTFYNSHGRGTYNINPVGGLSGFYIGETNFADHVSCIASSASITNGGAKAYADANFVTPSTLKTYAPLTKDVYQNYTALTIGIRNGDYRTVGSRSYAQGNQCIAQGDYSFAAGDQAKAYGEYSHAEGAQTTVTGKYTYAWSGDVNGYSPKGTGTYNIKPIGGISGFYIGNTDLGTHMTNVINSVTDATNPVFSNAVLAVGLNIDTNSVAQLNAIVDGFGGFPIEGTATTVGGLLAALAAAIAWLKKNTVKTDGSSIRMVKVSSESEIPDPPDPNTFYFIVGS